MAKNDKSPPLLTGFTSRETAGKGKALSSPTTSLWLAVIFVAIFFALMSVRMNIKRAEDSLKPPTPDTKQSGWIVDAPEKEVPLEPPPNYALLYPEGEEEENPLVITDEIVLENQANEIELKPIEVEMSLETPLSEQAEIPLEVDEN